MNPVTIKDIAQALKLSSSTISRALKSSHKISEETQRRVKEYAAAHRYKPNLHAQSLKSKNSRSIGLLVSAISNNFFGEVINGIESVAQIHDYHVIITQNHESAENEKKNLQHLMWRRVDGLLISVSSETEDCSHIREVYDQGTPIVFFDRVINEIDTHQVISDNVQGSYDATMHLIKSGFRRIAIVTSSPHLSITKQRLTGYEKALEEAGFPLRKEFVKYCLHGGMLMEEIEQAIDELLDLPARPDAIFTASDRITIKCFSEIKNRKIRIPNDMGIAGFSNFSHPELFGPALTTVRQPAFEMGKKAAELLIELIEQSKPKKKFQRVSLPTELNIRESSGQKNKSLKTL